MTLKGTERVTVARGAHAGRHGIILFVAGRRPELEAVIRLPPCCAYVALDGDLDGPGIAVSILIADLELEIPS